MRLPPIDLRRENTFGEFTYRNGGGYGPIGGDYLAFILVHLGSLKIEADGSILLLNAGQCALSLTRERYVTTAQDAITHISWCDGRPQHAGWLFKEREKFAAHIVASPLVQTLMQLGVDLGLGDEGGRGGVRESLTNALLHAFLYEAQAIEADRPIPQTILQARRFIEENFAADLSIERVAKQLRVSPQYLVSAFRKHLGVTPAKYLWRCRLDYGAHLLQRTGLSISEIAYQVGYKTPYHFSRQVKLAFDCSPTELREQKRNA